MSRFFVSAALALLVACSGTRSASDMPATDAPAPVEAPEKVGDAPVAIDAPPSEPTEVPLDQPTTPAALYGACKDRVEGVQTAGECTTDADCAKVGCSQEVCVPAKLAGEVMTTCEVLPCFKALDTCGCHEGMCSWTLRAELEPPGRIPLPAK